MPLSVLALGLVVSVVAAVLVYADASARELSMERRVAWAGAVGAVSAAGFGFSDAFGDELHRAYLHTVKPEPVVTSPLEGVALRIAVGLLVTAVALLLYVLQSRADSRSDR